MSGIQNTNRQIQQTCNDRLHPMQRSQRELQAGHLHQVQMVVPEKQDRGVLRCYQGNLSQRHRLKRLNKHVDHENQKPVDVHNHIVNRLAADSK